MACCSRSGQIKHPTANVVVVRLANLGQQAGLLCMQAVVALFYSTMCWVSMGKTKAQQVGRQARALRVSESATEAERGVAVVECAGWRAHFWSTHQAQKSR